MGRGAAVMDADHKTSGAEFAEWRDGADTEPLRKLSRRELREKYGDTRKKSDAELFDTEIPFGGPEDRFSNRLQPIDDRDNETIDKLVEKYGLARVLRSIREACDSRSPSIFEVDSTFSSLEEGEAWEAHAQEIESLIVKVST